MDINSVHAVGWPHSMRLRFTSHPPFTYYNLTITTALLRFHIIEWRRIPRSVIYTVMAHDSIPLYAAKWF